MKKSATLLALLAAMLCTFSCMKETDFGTGSAPEGYYEEIITTVIPGGGTRTSFDNTTGVFSWSEGDQIAFHLSNGEYIVAPIDPETSKVRLYIPEGVTRDEFAVYPASTIVTDHAEKGDMQLTLPDSYDISGALQSEYCPTTMLAVQDPESSTLQFNHAGGLVQLNLEVPAQTKTVKVEFPDRVVTGTIPISADNTYYKLDLDDPEHNEEGGSEIDVTVSQEGLEEDTAVRINVPVPSGTYNKVKITYNDGLRDTYEYEKNSSFTLNRSGGKRLSPNEGEFVPDQTNYFYFEALQDGSSITFQCDASDIYYSLDEKQTFNKYTSRTPISLNRGERVYFFNKNNQLRNSRTTSTFYNSQGSLKVGGILATLLNNEEAIYKNYNKAEKQYAYSNLFSYVYALIDAGSLDIGDDYNIFEYGFDHLFTNCSSLVTPPELPATTMEAYCYQNMFSECSSLTNAPELPATNLAHGCYNQMFNLCTSLSTAPELPATTLTHSCYANMFFSCTSLTVAPELPVTTLAPYCYQSMFANCTSLSHAPELPATSMTTNCYAYMFMNCSLAEPPVLPATTLAPNCYEGMFSGSSITTPPTLPATILSEYCYSRMFQNCTSLSSAPTLPATDLTDYCYNLMFSGCTSLSTAPELPAHILVNNCYSMMFYNCSNLNSITCLATDISATNCLNFWTYKVSSTGRFNRNKNNTSWTTGNSGIPSGWTVYTVEDVTPQI